MAERFLTKHLLVRISEEEDKKLKFLRQSGISIAVKVRNFIDSLYQTEIKSK